ncbi:hypothetical protein [Phenylobacterium sp.]|uniref:hypothetical protein n=1 Tax=Phenylobacterium sp. TaxID=1871053 RepID=UPI0035B17FC3
MSLDERPRSWAATVGLGGCVGALRESLGAADRVERPFRHWLLRGLLPWNILLALAALPFGAPEAASGEGTRESRNESRRYLDADAVAAFAACRAVARAFQAPSTVAAVERLAGVALDGAWLRIELAQDRDGFWLKPHTDLGVKRFTLLCYLDAEGQPEMGTDLYDGSGGWAGRAPFAPGAGLAFTPAGDTWHGFEPRPIAGVRKSLIVNYVSGAWRAREQLAFPCAPVHGPAPRRPRPFGGQ